MRTFWFFCKFIIDDVWSGGTAEEATKSGYLLMSECIKKGLYHPNCKDSHTTYFGDILDEEDEENDITSNDERAFTPEEQKLSEQRYEAEQRENYCERQTQRFERLSKYSLDEDNRKVYRARKNEWGEKLSITDKTVSEIKEKIYLNEEKQAQVRVRSTAQKHSAAAVMIGRGNVADVIQKLSFNTDNSEEKEEKRVANSAKNKFSYIDVTDEYLSNATPEIGNITRDNDYKKEKHKEEIEFAKWLHKTFGGNIHLYQEHTGKKYADYLWNGKLWDLKSVTTERAANNAVKSGHKQIKENPGGIMIDFGNNDFILVRLEKEIEERMKWYHNVQFDVMIVCKSKIVKILRYKK